MPHQPHAASSVSEWSPRKLAAAQSWWVDPTSIPPLDEATFLGRKKWILLDIEKMILGLIIRHKAGDSVADAKIVLLKDFATAVEMATDINPVIDLIRGHQNVPALQKNSHWFSWLYCGDSTTQRELASMADRFGQDSRTVDEKTFVLDIIRLLQERLEREYGRQTSKYHALEALRQDINNATYPTLQDMSDHLNEWMSRQPVKECLEQGSDFFSRNFGWSTENSNTQRALNELNSWLAQQARSNTPEPK